MDHVDSKSTQPGETPGILAILKKGNVQDAETDKKTYRSDFEIRRSI